MKDLITITERKGVQLVDARELHKKLKAGRDYSNWVKDRIKEYGFERNQDYFVEDNQFQSVDYQILRQNGRKGRPTIDYFITIDMAKELAMVERNEQGRKIRRYFIEVEKLARKQLMRVPASINVYGIKAMPYDWWLLQHGYSVSSGQRGRRIRNYPQHFYKTSEGKWYISELYASALLKIKEGKRELKQIPALPKLEQVEMFLEG